RPWAAAPALGYGPPPRPASGDGSAMGGARGLGGRHVRVARARGLADDLGADRKLASAPTVAGARHRKRRSASGKRHPMSEAIVELRDVFCVHRTNEGDAAALAGLNPELGRGQGLSLLG